MSADGASHQDAPVTHRVMAPFALIAGAHCGLGYLICACAAARRAIGTRYGEQLT